MKHAGPDTLDGLEPLLVDLRSLGGMREMKRGIFYVKSRAFLHFHEDPSGCFCDVRFEPSSGFERFPVNSQGERQIVLGKVADALASASRAS